MSDGSFLSGIVEGSGFAIGETALVVVVVAIAAGAGMSRENFIEWLGHKLAHLLKRAGRPTSDPERPSVTRKGNWRKNLFSWAFAARFAIWLFITSVTGFLAWNYFHPAENPSPIGKIAWSYESAAKGGGWFLGMMKVADKETRILGFQAHGKNVTKDPIHDLTGWMRSDITNLTKPIYILGQDNDDSQVLACIPRVPTTYDETYGIPALGEFDVVTFPYVGFAPTDGISTPTFLDTFAPFTIHLEYDGVTVERQFSKEEIQKQIDLFSQVLSLRSVPRVLRKENASKPKIHALQSIIATPVPRQNLPNLKLTPDDQFDLGPNGAVLTHKPPGSNGNSN